MVFQGKAAQLTMTLLVMAFVGVYMTAYWLFMERPKLRAMKLGTAPDRLATRWIPWSFQLCAGLMGLLSVGAAVFVQTRGIPSWAGIFGSFMLMLGVLMFLSLPYPPPAFKLCIKVSGVGYMIAGAAAVLAWAHYNTWLLLPLGVFVVLFSVAAVVFGYAAIRRIEV